MRGMRLSPHQRLVREMILQLKRGYLDAAYFRHKFGVDILDRWPRGLGRLRGGRSVLDRSADGPHRTDARRTAAGRRLAARVFRTAIPRDTLYMSRRACFFMNPRSSAEPCSSLCALFAIVHRATLTAQTTGTFIDRQAPSDLRVVSYNIWLRLDLFRHPLDPSGEVCPGHAGLRPDMIQLAGAL